MAMTVGTGGSGDPDVMVDINTTPLIDVMLVLLIMLIITIPIQTHAVKLNMPVNSDAKPPTPPTVVEIVVDFDGQIGFGGEETQCLHECVPVTVVLNGTKAHCSQCAFRGEAGSSISG